MKKAGASECETATIEQTRRRAGQMLRLDSSRREQPMIWEAVLALELFQMNEEPARAVMRHLIR